MNTSVKLLVESLNAHLVATEIVALPDGGTLVYFRHNGKQHAIRGVVPDLTSYTGRVIADHKGASSLMAQRISIPVPETIEYTDLRAAEEFLTKHEKIVVKPLDSAHGNGISTGVKSLKGVKKALALALKFSSKVLIQQQVSGTDLRVLVIGGEVVAVSERVPAGVTGDGKHTVKELIEQINRSPDRGEYYEKQLNRIKLDAAAKFVGAKQFKKVPNEGEWVQVIGTANIGSGGHAVNKTGQIPEEIATQAVRYAEATSMFICGVDFLYDEGAGTWYFLEANASPSFGLHLWPSKGESVDVTSIYVEKLLEAYDTP